MARISARLRRRRKSVDIQRDLQKLIKVSRKSGRLIEKNPRSKLVTYTGVGRDYTSAGAGSNSSPVNGEYITTDGIFTFIYG